MIIYKERITTIAETAILAEIIQVPEIQEIMVHRQGTPTVLVNILILVVMIMDHEDTVIEMDMGVDVSHVIITMIAQVVVPTEIPMMAMVTRVVLHLHEGPHHLTVEVVVMMTTAPALGMDMVEAVITTEVILTQVAAMIVLVGKIEAQLFQWKEAIPRVTRITAQAVVEIVDQGAAETATTGAVVEADTKTELDITMDQKKPLLIVLFFLTETQQKLR